MRRPSTTWPRWAASSSSAFPAIAAACPTNKAWKNCATGLKRLLPLAEKLGVTLVMELLNSKVNHQDYMCDRTAWGVALCEKISSPNFRLLYDIYHMQIMEGDSFRPYAPATAGSPTTTPAAFPARGDR